MRHDDRYSMVNKRYAHVMAQHGIKNAWKRERKNWGMNWLWFSSVRFRIDLIGIVRARQFLRCLMLVTKSTFEYFFIKIFTSAQSSSVLS